MATQKTPLRPYALRKPCKRCPFRSDVAPYLRHDRVVEISHSIQSGEEFPCHETTQADADRPYTTKDSKHCAGAMILALKANPSHSTQMMRITERLGDGVENFDPDRLDMDSPIPDSWQEWVDRFDPTPEDQRKQHCGVSGPDCEDPAGWMMGQVVTNVGPGTAEAECTQCGNDMCADCTAEDEGEDGPVCIYCSEDED